MNMNGAGASFQGAAIAAQGLRKVYGAHEAVKNVDLLVKPGEIVGFLGPNGAGKTTTIKMLTGLLKPTAGQRGIMGHDIQREPVAAKAAFGYVPDTPNLYGKLSGWEFLRFMGRLYRVPQAQAERRAGELLRLFDLNDRGQRPDRGLQPWHAAEDRAGRARWCMTRRCSSWTSRPWASTRARPA